jgi:phenylalanyl-tRNA synthetase beta subunit
MLFSIELRAPDRTLTGDEADAVCKTIVERCGEQLGAKLLA